MFDQQYIYIVINIQNLIISVVKVIKCSKIVCRFVSANNYWINSKTHWPIERYIVPELHRLYSTSVVIILQSLGGGQFCLNFNSKTLLIYYIDPENEWSYMGTTFVQKQIGR